MKRLKFVFVASLAMVIFTLGGSSLTKEASAATKPIIVTTNEYRTEEFQNPPLLEKGTVYLPLRETGALMNGKTTWISEGKHIIINSPTTHIEMKLGSKYAIVNGKEYTMAAIPKNKNGVVYVPVRFVTEALGAQVDWIAKERRVNLTFKNQYLYAEKGEKAIG